MAILSGTAETCLINGSFYLADRYICPFFLFLALIQDFWKATSSLYSSNVNRVFHVNLKH